MRIARYGFVAASALALFGMAQISHARIISSGSGATLRYGYHNGPGGGLDADTLHYWSLDESGASFADTGSSSTPIDMLTPDSGGAATASVSSVLFSADGATNNARRFGTGDNGPQYIAFGLNVLTGADHISADQANSLYGVDGAITVDLLLQPDFGTTYDSGATMGLITQVNHLDKPVNLWVGYNADLTQNGHHQIEFHMGGEQVNMIVPFSGDHALDSGSWYHFAVTYNGDENGTNNVKFYWTKVIGPTDTTTAASLASLATISDDPATLSEGPKFTFGNRNSRAGNTTSNRAFQGVLDEIRISAVARGPGEFLFRSPGDFDGDGDVDGADFVAWQTNFPTAEGATLEDGDADGDGDVDGADFVVWQTNFPFTPSPGVAPVPEPSAGLLIAGAALILGVVQAIRRQKARNLAAVPSR